MLRHPLANIAMPADNDFGVVLAIVAVVGIVAAREIVMVIVVVLAMVAVIVMVLAIVALIIVREVLGKCTRGRALYGRLYFQSVFNQAESSQV